MKQLAFCAICFCSTLSALAQVGKIPMPYSGDVDITINGKKVKPLAKPGTQQAYPIVKFNDSTRVATLSLDRMPCYVPEVKEMAKMPVYKQFNSPLQRKILIEPR